MADRNHEIVKALVGKICSAYCEPGCPRAPITAEQNEATFCYRIEVAHL